MSRTPKHVTASGVNRFCRRSTGRYPAPGPARIVNALTMRHPGVEEREQAKTVPKNDCAQGFPLSAFLRRVRIPGYAFDAKLYEGSSTIVYAGMRESDHAAVVAKVIVGGARDLRRELAMGGTSPPAAWIATASML